MSKAKNKRKREARKAAKKKIPRLFKRAHEHTSQKVADRLIRRARRTAMKFRMTLRPYKHLFCKHCYKRLIPGRTCRVRVQGGKVIYYCFSCKKYRRIPIKQQPRG